MTINMTVGRYFVNRPSGRTTAADGPAEISFSVPQGALPWKPNFCWPLISFSRTRLSSSVQWQFRSGGGGGQAPPDRG